MNDLIDVSREAELSKKDFKKFQELIHSITGIWMGESKQTLVQSRLAKRLRALRIGSYSEYYDYVSTPQGMRDEQEEFVNCVTTNKTDFFRESHHFDFLREQLFPKLREHAAQTGEQKIRIWSAACSTGAEPYTLAMTIREYFGSALGWDIRILASDIDTSVLRTASTGIYREDQMSGVNAEMRRKYFRKVKKDGEVQWEVVENLKDLITFRRLNFSEPTWSINAKFDVIMCRNVMIYFNQETQRQLVGRFCQYLHPEAHLIIGHSESLIGVSDDFQSIGNTIYRLKEGVVKRTAKPTVPKPQAQQSVTSAPKPKKTPSAEEKRRAMKAATPPPSRNNRPALVGPTSSRAGGDGLPTSQIIVGEFKASATPMRISTLVGSCIAACIYDEVNQVGGMNHFMLPESHGEVCARFGVHAMELLINSIMQLGGDRRRLKAKFFGGARVVAGGAGVWTVGERNAKFAEDFLNTEGIPIVAKHVGGERGMKIQFISHLGKAFVTPIERSDAESDAVQRQIAPPVSIVEQVPEVSTVELF
ncbi:MAG: hypothetical protein KDA87_07385 [Planctomycetales bacterium]|nr:hypothetical protein [Planctomycetales bacterium]